MLLYRNELKRKHIVRYDICRCRHKCFIKNQHTLFQPESGRKEKASITLSFKKQIFPFAYGFKGIHRPTGCRKRFWRARRGPYPKGGGPKTFATVLCIAKSILELVLPKKYQKKEGKSTSSIKKSSFSLFLNQKYLLR
jgi:hypothetical protein